VACAHLVCTDWAIVYRFPPPPYILNQARLEGFRVELGFSNTRPLVQGVCRGYLYKHSFSQISMEFIATLGMWNPTPHISKGWGVGCPLVPGGSLSCRWLVRMSWMPVSRIVLFVNYLTGPGGMFGIAHKSTAYATYHVTLVVHVCATAHLTNWVCRDCLGGPAKRAELRWENRDSAYEGES
jgi:hypothetical protein